MQTDFPLDPWSINLIRRLEDLLDLMESRGFVLVPQIGSDRDIGSLPQAPSGYSVEYELWITIIQLTEALVVRNLLLDDELSATGREEALSHFTTVASLSEASFEDVLRFLRAATWTPLDRDELDIQEFSRLIRQSPFDGVYESGRVVAALQRMKELCQPTQEDIIRVLRFKSIFDSLTVEQFRNWNARDSRDLEASEEARYVPYPSYHPAVWEWNDVVYETLYYINPYRGERPGDPIPHPRFLNLGERGHPTPEEFFAQADLDEVRQYMAVCLRGEKWCDGHIACEFERGVIRAAFQRLSELENALRVA